MSAPIHAIQKRIATGTADPKDTKLAEKYKADALGIVKAYEARMGHTDVVGNSKLCATEF